MRTELRQGMEQFLWLRFSSPARGAEAVHPRYINGSAAAPQRLRPAPAPVISVTYQQLSGTYPAFFYLSGTGVAA